MTTEKAASKEAVRAALEILPVCGHGGLPCSICANYSRQVAAALDSFAAEHDAAARSAITDLDTELGMANAYVADLRERNEALVGMIAAWHSGGHAGANHPGHRDACEVGMCGMYRGALAADAKTGEDR